MKRFKEGDVLVNPRTTSTKEWLVIRVLSDKYILSASTSQLNFTADRDTVHRNTVLKNTNIITTSSLDYMKNDELTEEDKKIIEEALKEYD